MEVGDRVDSNMAKIILTMGGSVREYREGSASVTWLLKEGQPTFYRDKEGPFQAVEYRDVEDWFRSTSYKYITIVNLPPKMESEKSRTDLLEEDWVASPKEGIWKRVRGLWGRVNNRLR